MPVQVSYQNICSGSFLVLKLLGVGFQSLATAQIVQGGISIKQSLDELAATCLTYNYSEPPRLVSVLVLLPRIVFVTS